MPQQDEQNSASGLSSTTAGSSLQQLYINTTREYRAFFEKVRVAFHAHCDEIKVRTQAKLDALAEDDKEGRKQVLLDQKKELDQGLAELKQLLARESARMRQTLEEIRRKQEEQSFDLEEELSELELTSKQTV